MQQTKTILPTLLCLLMFSSSLFAQPEPCGDPPAMTPLCGDACIICDIDGFTGINNSGVSGDLPDDFCTTTVHNAGWIAFIAGSTSLEINLSVSNCQTNWGLELALYESTDCETFNLISNCIGDVSGGSTGTFITNEPLTIGQYYYITMDGNGGDVCNWTFNVVSGSTTVDPLFDSGVISGNFNTCPNSPMEYATTGELGATIYDWTVNGAFVAEGQAVTLDWTMDGTYELCVTASNACDEAPPTCQTVVVTTPTPTVLDELICEGEIFVINALEVSVSGVYTFGLLDIGGCDSTVQLFLEVLEAPFTELAFNICEGDSIFIGETPFFETGEYSAIFPNFIGCDSIVALDLGIIICEMAGITNETPAVCFGETSGELIFSVTTGTPPFNYAWQHITGSPSGNGVLSSDNQLENISGLAVGTYLITINDNFGNDLILIGEVSQPPVLTGTLMASDFNGSNISCFGEKDGFIEAMIEGGVSPYQYAWSNGSDAALASDLLAGNHSLTITDNIGCTLVLSQNLSQTEALTFDLVFADLTCEGFESGTIQATGINGGTAPYLFDNSGSGFSNEQVFDNLPEGSYTITIQDMNGCETDSSTTLTAPIIPILELSPTQTINLAESTTLNVSANNMDLDSTNMVWSPAAGLSCTNCPNPTAMPFETITYAVMVTSPDGCVTTDSVQVNVTNRRRVVVPNALSPNNDGLNDVLTVFGGAEIIEIRTFRVFNRWGEQVFEANNFQPNHNDISWDGTHNFRPAPSGVYVWYAEILFIDEVVEIYKGNATVIR